MSYGVGLRNGVAFALGTIPSLTSGGVLRPSLLLDFLSGSLDPRITFSRGTQAMQYGSDGTLQYAPNNLLTYSNQADNAAWTKSNSFVQTNLLLYSEQFDNVAWGKSLITVTANATIAPDGTLTADRIISAGGAYPQTSQNPTLAAGDYTFSLWVKSDGTPQIAQSLLLDGTPVNFTPTDTWTRVSVTKTGVLAGSRGIVLATNSATAPASSFYVWGAQLVQGSVPGDYRATTSAALPVLYADYNGALRARKLCEDSSNSTHNFNENAGTVGNTETLSFYAKSGERSWAISQLGGSHLAYFDLTNGVLGNVSGGATATIVASGSGWYRCTLTAPRALNTSNFIYCTTGNAVSTYSGNGSSGIYIADAQLTPGYLPLAVTETTSAAVYGPRFDYDPSSLVRQNLLTYSQDLSAYWTYGTGVTLNSSAITAPDGTLTARTVNYSSGGATEFLRNSTSAIAASIAQTFSFWAKSISGNTSFSADLQNIESTTVTLTSEWQRFTWTVTPAAARTWIDFQLGAAGTVALWGVQLNTGSTALPYTATTTAPYTLTTARGLLIEEQRTNLIAQSNSFGNGTTPTSPWALSANTNLISANATSPEGIVNATRLYASNGLTAGGLLYGFAKAASPVQYTSSVYVKAAGYNFVQLAVYDSVADGNRYWFNLSTGAVGSTSVIGAGFTGLSTAVTNVGNGWYRCSVTATSNSAATFNMYIYPALSDGSNGNGDAFTDGVYIYQAQVETGAFATSIIPTVGSTATRNADSASITTLTPWFNAAAGTLFASGTRINSNAPSGSIMEIGDGTSNNRYMIYVGSPFPDGGYIVTTGGVAQATIAVVNGFPTNTIGKVAAAYALNDFQQATNATLGTADTLGTLPTVTTMYIGSNSGGSVWDGWVRSIRYYPTRLPNASLQSITV